MYEYAGSSGMGYSQASPSREWVDKQRSMCTSLRGRGTTRWSLVQVKVDSRENPVHYVRPPFVALKNKYSH